MPTTIPTSAIFAPIRMAPIGSPLAPVIAGARARGVADAFEWLGLAAVLLDERGEALHANAGAVALMGGALRLDCGRLRAEDPTADASLSQAIRDVVETGATARVDIPAARGGRGVAARIGAMAPMLDDPYQLLRAIAILEPQPPSH
ncbi:MAG: hypothetical protein ACLPN5_12350 [Roseiarcus sp.]